jgi:hypothetical protein
MSDMAKGPGWWMASDRKWYPPESHPDADLPAGTGYVLNSGLTTATRILSWITAAGTFLFAAALVHEAWRFDQWWNASGFSTDELQDLLDAEDISSTASALTFMVAIALFVLMIIWLTKARRTANRFGGTETNWSPGWAIGAWFIPLANFILVKLIFMEVERLSTPAADPVPVGTRWKRTRLNPDGWWWFFLGITAVVVAIVGNSLSDVGDEGLFEFDSGQYRAGLIIGAVASCIAGASLIVGASMLKRLDGQLRRAPLEA